MDESAGRALGEALGDAGDAHAVGAVEEDEARGARGAAVQLQQLVDHRPEGLALLRRFQTSRRLHGRGLCKWVAIGRIDVAGVAPGRGRNLADGLGVA